jgi:hypothetical protein
MRKAVRPHSLGSQDGSFGMDNDAIGGCRNPVTATAHEPTTLK